MNNELPDGQTQALNTITLETVEEGSQCIFSNYETLDFRP